MKNKVLIILAAILLFPLGAWGADATSYTPVGVPQYSHIPMGGYQVQNAGSYGLASGGAVTSNGGVGSSTVVQSASGVIYAVNNAWSTGGLSTGWVQDYDNPAFYLDPAGTSVANRILVNYIPSAPQDAATKQYVDSKVGGAASLAPNGYQILPSGLMIQWMTVTVPNQNATTGFWATPFPTTCLNVQVTSTLVGWGATNTHYGATGDRTQWTIYKGGDTQLTFRLFAIGY